MPKKILSFILIVSFLAGCSQCLLIRSEYYDITGQVLSPKSSTREISIYTESPQQPYKEIGVVKVLAHLGTTREAMEEELKKRARAGGADALIDVKYGEDTVNEVRFCGRIFSSKRNASATAKAIVFTENQ
ncbi:MAG: hypothetical protein V1863_01765 [Candidatus Omnitrophota bacterium]